MFYSDVLETIGHRHSLIDFEVMEILLVLRFVNERHVAFWQHFGVECLGGHLGRLLLDVVFLVVGLQLVRIVVPHFVMVLLHVRVVLQIVLELLIVILVARLEDALHPGFRTVVLSCIHETYYRRCTASIRIFGGELKD